MKKITVFCGSSEGINPLFGKTAYQLGSKLAKEGIELIYGGAKIGLMGKVANGAIDSGIEHTKLDLATAFISLLVDKISLQFSTLCLINFKVTLLLELILDFGSLIRINGIRDIEVITITTSSPSKKPSMSPFFWI